jgi:hypothetical protein
MNDIEAGGSINSSSTRNALESSVFIDKNTQAINFLELTLKQKNSEDEKNR